MMRVLCFIFFLIPKFAFSISPSKAIEQQYLPQFGMGSEQERLVQIFSSLQNDNLSPLGIVSDVWGDLDMYSPSQTHVLNTMFPTQTLFGEVYGALFLAYQASSDKYVLQERQNKIHKLVKDTELTKLLISHLQNIKTREGALLSIYDKQHPMNTEKTQLMFQDETFFEGKAWDIKESAKLQNRSFPLLLWNILVIHYLAPLVIVPFQFKLVYLTSNAIENTLLRTVYLSWIAYTNTMIFAHLYYDDSLKTANTSLTETLQSINPIIKAILELSKLDKKLPLGLKLRLTSKEQEDLKTLHKEILDLQSPEQSGVFYQMNLAKALASTRLLVDLRKTLLRMISKIGELDVYTAIAIRLMDDDKRYSFAHFVDKGPFIKATGVWNPLLDLSQAVSNDVVLGGENPRNFVITGHNASGKSTLMRAVGLALYLSHLFGVAPAEEMSLSMFSSLNSFMKTEDSVGERSSFQAEVENNRRVMSLYKVLREDEYAFLISDEPFRSTNGEEAAIASQTVFQFLCERPQVMFLVSTHLENLTNFSGGERCGLVNKHMEVMNIDGETQYTYKLVDGVSSDTNALTLLKKRLKVGSSL
jgi:hypothetical protein